MSKKIRNKLQSERGASLIMALLLFLVCMVVSSVLITAATASAGRLSQMVEMDKRYYAVSSAASLMTEQINGKKVEVTYRKNDAGKMERKSPVETHTDHLDFLSSQTVQLTDVLAHVKDAALADSVFVLQPKRPQSDDPYQEQLPYQDQLKVEMDVTWRTLAERSMVLTVSNVVANSNEDAYKIKLTCTADVLKKESLVSVDGKNEEQTVYEVTWSVPELGR